MILLIALLIAALIFGGIGLFVTGVKWLLIVAAVLLIAGLIVGVLRRGKSTRQL